MSKKSRIKIQLQEIKRILLYCLIATFVSCTNSNEFGLKGDVKSYFERHYEVEKKLGKWEIGDIEYYGRHHRVTFDKKGLYQEIEYFDADLNLTGKSFPIRENGKVVEEIIHDEGFQFKIIFEHVSKNEYYYESFNSDEKKTVQGKTILKNGKVVKQIGTIMTNETENETYTTLFEYDKNGNLIFQKETNKKGEIRSFRFEYLEFDAKKNWTKRLTFRDDNDVPINIEIREIEYH